MANRYWVGGTGTWDAADTTHWSASSGGASGASVPTAADDVFFDGSSGAGIVDIGTNNVNCLSLDFTGYVGDITNLDPLFTVFNINIFNNLTVSAAMDVLTNVNFVMRATSGTHTMTFNGNISNMRLVINGNGGTFQLVDSYRGVGFTHTNGTFDPNGNTVTVTNGGYIFCNNLLTNFFNLTITGAVQIVTFGGHTLNVTGTFTMNGLSQTNRYFLKSSSTFGVSESNIGLTKIINAANVSISNCDFQDITGAGAGLWTGSSIGDGLGNSGITFTAPTTRYWVGNGGNWNDTAHWSASSGGASGATMPLPQDDVFFDANSFSSGGQIITANYRFLGTDVDFTGVTNSPNLRMALSTSIVRTNQNIVLGNLTLASGMTVSNTTQNNSLTMESRSGSSITTNGVVLGTNFIISTYLSTFNLNDDIDLGSSNYAFAFGTGTLNTNNFNITCGVFRAISSLPRTMNMGSSTVTVNGANSSTQYWNSNAIWNLSSGLLTYNESTSQIIITNTTATQKTFSGANITYYDIEITGDNILITGNNSFHDFEINNAGEVNGLILNNGTTQTITGTLSSNGSVGNLTKISESGVGVNGALSKSSGKICLDYLDLTGVTATGGANFRAGLNSVDGGGNLGWQFIACGSGPMCEFFMMFG